MSGSKIRLREVTKGPGGRTWESDYSLRVGRWEGVDVVLNDLSVSRRHAEFRWNSEGWWLKDLGSRNGTFLNGQQIGCAERKLQKGDIVQCGDVPLTVEDITPLVSPQPAAARHAAGQVLLGWEDVPSVLAECQDAGRRAALVSLLKLGRMIPPGDTLQGYCNLILWDVAEALDTRYAAILTGDPHIGSLRVEAFLGLGSTIDQGEVRQFLLVKEAFQRFVSVRGRVPCEKTMLPRELSQGQPTSVPAVCCMLRQSGLRFGVLFLARDADQPPFTEQELRLADAMTLGLSLSLEGVRRILEKQTTDLAGLLSVVTSLGNLQHANFRLHTQRVMEIALVLSDALGLGEPAGQHLQIGSQLHDIGMVGMNEAIIRKPGPLTPAELAYVQSHVIRGVSILESIPQLAPVLPMVRSHHERWDGTGYPDRLAGTRIPLLARVVGAADAVAAMTDDRPYRPRLTMDQVFAELQRCRGTQFDPECVDALLQRSSYVQDLLRAHSSPEKTLTPANLQTLMDMEI